MKFLLNLLSSTSRYKPPPNPLSAVLGSLPYMRKTESASQKCKSAEVITWEFDEEIESSPLPPRGIIDDTEVENVTVDRLIEETTKSLD